MSFRLPPPVGSALAGMFGARNRSQRRRFRKHWPSMIAGGTGLSKKTGVVAKSDGGGSNTTQDIALGFADAKFVILWANNETAEDAFHAQGTLAYGFSDGTTHYCIADVKRDAQATADTYRYCNSTALALLGAGGAGAPVAECTASWSGSNLRLTWSTGDSGAQLLHYFVLGGDFSAAVVTSLTAKTSTGSRDQTPLSFTPDFVHFLSDQTTSALGTSAENHSRQAWGFAASNGQTAECGYESEDASAASAAFTQMSNNSSFLPVYMKGGATAVNGLMTVTAFITNGWTENWTVAGGSAFSYGALALAGLSYAIKKVDSATSTGDHAVTGFGIAPEAVLAFSSEVSSGAPLAPYAGNASLGVGAATSTSDENAAWNGDAYGADPTACDRRDSATYFMLHATPGTPTLTLAASMTSFDADGITPNYNTAPGTALGLLFVAFAVPVVTSNRRRLLAQVI